MVTSIGFVELNSIAKGIETADFMIKSANINLIYSKPVCPGKFIILVSGDIGSVNTAVQVGIEKGGHFVVDTLIIANVSEQVIKAINATTTIDKVNALGVVEYFSVTGAIIGADAAAKAGDVKIIEVRLGVGIGGKSFLTLSGSVSSVDESVSAATRDAIEKGMLVSSCVIPSPSEELFYSLC